MRPCDAFHSPSNRLLRLSFFSLLICLIVMYPVTLLFLIESIESIVHLATTPSRKLLLHISYIHFSKKQTEFKVIFLLCHVPSVFLQKFLPLNLPSLALRYRNRETTAFILDVRYLIFIFLNDFDNVIFQLWHKLIRLKRRRCNKEIVHVIWSNSVAIEFCNGYNF